MARLLLFFYSVELVVDLGKIRFSGSLIMEGGGRQGSVCGCVLLGVVRGNEKVKKHCVFSYGAI